jgi:hypothetical protein
VLKSSREGFGKETNKFKVVEERREGSKGTLDGC